MEFDWLSDMRSTCLWSEYFVLILHHKSSAFQHQRENESSYSLESIHAVLLLVFMGAHWWWRNSEMFLWQAAANLCHLCTRVTLFWVTLGKRKIELRPRQQQRHCSKISIGGPVKQLKRRCILFNCIQFGLDTLCLESWKNFCLLQYSDLVQSEGIFRNLSLGFIQEKQVKSVWKISTHLVRTMYGMHLDIHILTCQSGRGGLPGTCVETPDKEFELLVTISNDRISIKDIHLPWDPGGFSSGLRACRVLSGRECHGLGRRLDTSMGQDRLSAQVNVMGLQRKMLLERKDPQNGIEL